jgi:S1-C subfamily serine protease
VPLIEIRFEQSSDRVAGAILFDQSGQLVGVLGATLAATKPIPAALSMAKSLDSAPAGAMLQAREAGADFGPQPLTTGYALGIPVLARVVKGFATPSHVVQHPTIGISFKDEGGTNRITQVDRGSNAYSAGLREGDVVLAVGPRSVRSAVELGSALFELEIGSTVPLTVQRGSDRVSLRVKVAGS